MLPPLAELLFGASATTTAEGKSTSALPLGQPDLKPSSASVFSVTMAAVGQTIGVPGPNQQPPIQPTPPNGIAVITPLDAERGSASGYGMPVTGVPSPDALASGDPDRLVSESAYYATPFDATGQTKLSPAEDQMPSIALATNGNLGPETGTPLPLVESPASVEPVLSAAVASVLPPDSASARGQTMTSVALAKLGAKTTPTPPSSERPVETVPLASLPSVNPRPGSGILEINPGSERGLHLPSALPERLTREFSHPSTPPLRPAAATASEATSLATANPHTRLGDAVSSVGQPKDGPVAPPTLAATETLAVIRESLATHQSQRNTPVSLRSASAYANPDDGPLPGSRPMVSTSPVSDAQAAAQQTLAKEEAALRVAPPNAAGVAASINPGLRAVVEPYLTAATLRARAAQSFALRGDDASTQNLNLAAQALTSAGAKMPTSSSLPSPALQTLPMQSSTAAAGTATTLDVGGLSGERLANRLSQFIAGQQATDGTVRVSLRPVALGEMQFTFRRGSNGLDVTLNAQQPQTRQLLEEHTQSIRTMLQDLGSRDAQVQLAARWVAGNLSWWRELGARGYIGSRGIGPNLVLRTNNRRRRNSPRDKTLINNRLCCLMLKITRLVKAG